ncbi:MAG: hypothetical protein IJM42_00270 [Synergistes sp.]|nr:hypothetical protein [Synergistes sp.]MCR5335319.1 hypothetical protein [Synergistes sp.]
MPTKEQVKYDILCMMRDGAPKEYARRKKQDPKGLAEWAEAAASIAMAEIKAETYPGENPDMIWSDLKPILSKNWLEEFGVRDEEEEVDPEVAAGIAEAMAFLRAKPGDEN